MNDEQEVLEPEQEILDPQPQPLTTDTNWYLRYQWNGTLPAVAMDFINNMYWNGTTTLNVPTTFMTNAVLAAGHGLDSTSANANANNMQAIGPLLAAFQGGTYTFMVGTNTVNASLGGGNGVTVASDATGGAVADLLLNIDGNPHQRTYQSSGTSFLGTLNAVPLSYSFMSVSTSTPGNYRFLWDAQLGNVGDTHPLAANPAQIYIAGATPAFPASVLNGYIGHLAVIKAVPPNVLNAYVTNIPAFTGPNAYWCNYGTVSAIDYGNVLQYEYTQPWTVIAAFYDALQTVNPPTTANGVIFTTSMNNPFPGYEIWIPGTNVIGVRIISNFGAGFYIGKMGTTNIADLKWHVVAVTYDGSGLASGINIYLDGVLETMTVEHDGLAGHSIVGGANNDYQIGNQTNNLGLIGAIGLFRQYNTVKSLSFIQQFTNIFTQNQQVPAIDSTCVLAPALTEGAPSLTTADLSNSHLTGTLTSVNCWLRGVSVPIPTPPGSSLFPAFTPLLPPPLIGQGGGPPPTFPPTSGTAPVPIPPGVLVGPAIALPTVIAGKALIIFGTGSATAPTMVSWFPSFTTTFPAPTFVVSNVWTVPTLSGGVWTTHLPAQTATTPCVPTGGWGSPGPSGSGPGPPSYPTPPGTGLPHHDLNILATQAENDNGDDPSAEAESAETPRRRRRKSA